MTSNQHVDRPSSDAELGSAAQAPAGSSPPPADRTLPIPTKGAEVLTSDGQGLGRVAEIRGEYFKVDAPMSPDYWLPLAQARPTTGGVVSLTFASSALDDYKTSETPEEPALDEELPGPLEQRALRRSGM